MSSFVFSNSDDIVVQHVMQSMSQLRSLWQEIGFDSQTMNDRSDAVRKHIECMMDDMIAEEVSHKDKIIEHISNYKAQVIKVATELGQSSSAVEVCDWM